MNIISQKEKKGRILDGIDTLLHLNDETFRQAVEHLKADDDEKLEGLSFYYVTDSCKRPQNAIQVGLENIKDENGKIISRIYNRIADAPSVAQIFEIMNEELRKYPEGSDEYKRIVELIKTRNEEAIKHIYIENTCGLEEKAIFEKIFKMLSDEDTFNKLLDYDNNKKFFSIDGKEVHINTYLKCIGEILGDLDKNGNSERINRLLINFYIPNLELYRERYITLYKKYNFDRVLNPYFIFEKMDIEGEYKIIKDADEPDWQINPELYDFVYDGMPKDASIEDKMMHIYFKLAQCISYDETWFYEEENEVVACSNAFSKKELQSVKPGSKIKCWNYSRVLAKLINSLGKDITAVIISTGKNGSHFHVGVYTNNISAEVEALNLSGNRINDTVKVRNGININGFKVNFDKFGIMNGVYERAYDRFYGEKRQDVDSYVNYLNTLKETKLKERRTVNDSNIDNLALNLEAFIEVLREKGMSGYEALQVLYRAGYLIDGVERAHIMVRVEEDDQIKYKRMVLYRENGENSQIDVNNNIYLIDSIRMRMRVCKIEELCAMFRNGEILKYEKDDKVIQGIRRLVFNIVVMI